MPPGTEHLGQSDPRPFNLPRASLATQGGDSSINFAFNRLHFDAK